MRIAVGFRVTPDYDLLRPADWKRAEGAGGPGGDVVRAEATRYVRKALGAFDEAALELALRLRDARADRGLATAVAAFSVGGREADPFLKTLQALGYECARADAGAELDFAPSATAELVAACARRLGGDVLLLGARSGPGDGGQVPFLAAEALGRPCLTEVTEIVPADDRRLRVTFAAASRPARATIGAPCVLAVGNAVVSMLRVPTLKDRLATKSRPVVALSAEDVGVDIAGALAREPSRLAGLEAVDRRRAAAIVAGATPAEKARALYETHLRTRLEGL